MREKITLDKRIRDKKERGNYERKEGEKHEQEPPIEFDRFEKIPGEIKNVLLQLVSAEYYKAEDKQNEGVPFAENVFDDRRKVLLEDGDGVLGKQPTFLATVMKDPNIKGIIDPDATRVKNASENPERDAMTRLYQKKIGEIIIEQMEKGKPFLHMLISERRKGADDTIVLAGGMRNGKLPASPQIIRWFAEKLEKKLDEDKITVNGKSVKVKINIEGEPICGARVHVERKAALGDMYQFIKGKVPAGLLVGDNSNKVINVFAEMAQEFQNKFSDEQEFEDFLNDNTEESDKNKLEGKLYYEDGLQESEEIDNDKIAMGDSLRRAFAGGLKIGDMVYIYNADNLSENGKPKVKMALEIVSAKVKNRSEDQKVGYRKPAISSNAINDLGGRNVNIVVEKKV